MTTPAQEAKEFAAANRFEIKPSGRRYIVVHEYGWQFDVGGYPAALNAMKRYVEEMGNVQSDSTVTESVESVADAATGKVEFGIPADTIVGEKPAFELQRVVNALTDGTVDTADLPIKAGEGHWSTPATEIKPLRPEERKAINDWIAGNFRHLFAPGVVNPFDRPFDVRRENPGAWQRQTRTGYYVRITGQNGATLSDIWCGSLKEAYRCCASSAQFIKRNGWTAITKRSVIFKRGA